MVSQTGAIVLEWLVSLATAILELILRLMVTAATAMRFLCSARFRAEYRTRDRDRPALLWVRLGASGAAFGLLVLLAAWVVQLATQEHVEPALDRHARIETRLGIWALDVSRQLSHRATKDASGASPKPAP